MDYFVGLDVSLRSVAICVVDADGKHVFERAVACEIEDIVGCLRDVPTGQCRIGFESGAMSQHLYFGLRKAGFDVSQALPVGQLREGHRVELIEARERLDLVLAAVAPNATAKRAEWQVLHHLRKHVLALVHRSASPPPARWRG